MRRIALLYGRDGLLVDKFKVANAMPVIEMFDPGRYDEALVEMADDFFLQDCGIKPDLAAPAPVKTRRFYLAHRFRELHGGDTLVYRENQ